MAQRQSFMAIPPSPIRPINGLSLNRQDPLQVNNIMAPWRVNMPPSLQSPYPVPHYINEITMGLRSSVPAPYGNGFGASEFPYDLNKNYVF